MSRLLYPHTKSSQSVQDSLSTDDLRYWLALLYAPGVGPVLFQRILSAKIQPEQLFHNPAGDTKEVKVAKKARCC